MIVFSAQINYFKIINQIKKKKRKQLDLRKIAEFNESEGFLLIVKLIVISTTRCKVTVFLKATEIIVSHYVIVFKKADPN